MSIPAADRAVSPSRVSHLTSVTRVDGQLRPGTRPVRMATWSRTRPVITPEPQEAEGPPADGGRGRVAYVPLVGRIVAGDPILAEESVEGIFPLPRQLVGEGTLFLLQVSGDSMINAQITDGDWVIVRQQPTAENGEIVAALLQGEATIKTLKRSDDHTWLMPRNPAHSPILGDEAIIMGKIVALLRRFHDY